MDNSGTDATLSGCWQYTDGVVGLWTAGQRIDPQSCQSPFAWKTSSCSMSEMAYADWCAGQPDYWRGEESCANVFVYRQSNDTQICLNDIHCAQDMCFVCEIDL